MKILGYIKKTVSLEDILRSLDRILTCKKFVLPSLLILISLFFIAQTLPSFFTWDTDSPSFYIGAKGMVQGIRIYEQTEFQSLAESEFGKSMSVYPYIYLPFVAQSFIPLSFLGSSAYFTLLYILNVLLTFACLFLVYLLLKGQSRENNRLLLFFLFLMLIYNLPLRATINHGQVNIFVFFLILLAFFLEKNKQTYAASFILSLAILFKIYPVIFLVYFLFKKKFRFLGFTSLNLGGLFALSSIVFGIRYWISYVQMNLHTLNSGSLSSYIMGFSSHQDNNSLKAFLSQLFQKTSPASETLIYAAAAGGLFLFILLFSWHYRKRISAAGFPLIGSGLFVLSLMALPITWSHHYVIMIFPLAYLFNRSLSLKNSWLLIFSVLATCLILSYPRYGGFPFNQIRFISISAYLAVLLASVLTFSGFKRKFPEKGEKIR